MMEGCWNAVSTRGGVIVVYTFDSRCFAAIEKSPRRWRSNQRVVDTNGGKGV